MAAVALAGSLAGIAAAFMSGSRGALLALPVILLLLAPVLWQRSRRIFLAVSVFLAVFATVMLAGNVGRTSTRIMTAYAQISALIAGDEKVSDRSVGDRTKLLLLSYRLFQEEPLLGVGVKRWNAAVAELANAPDPADRLALPYNQAHNQYADDLAKGGIVRFLLGFLILFMPLYLFLKREPFSGQKGSEFALAGVVTSRRLHDLLSQRIADDPEPHRNGAHDHDLLSSGGMRRACVARPKQSPHSASGFEVGFLATV